MAEVFAAVVTPVTAVLAGGACLLAGRRFDGRTRTAWRLLAVACWSWALGNVLPGLGGPALARPIAGDLVGAVFATAGLLLMPPLRTLLLAVRAAMDGMIVGGVLLWISLGLVGDPVLDSVEGGGLLPALRLACTIADVAIVAAALYSVIYSSRGARPLVATLAAGWSVIAVSQGARVYLDATASMQGIQIVEIAWIAGFGLAGFAAFLAAQRTWTQEESDRRPIVGSILVYVAIAAGLAATILEPRHERTAGLLYWLAIAIVVVLFLRQVLGVLDNRQLERDRRAAEKALQSSEARLEQVLEQAPVVIFAVEASGLITLAKGRGLPDVSEAVGYNMFADAPDHPLHAVIDPALRGEETHGEVTVRERLLELHCSPVVVNGVVTGMIGVAIDITDRSAAEQARRESEAKDRFLASMSHELRTPLNSILGFAQMLKLEVHGQLNDRQRRYVENVLGSGRQLLDLITEVLDLAKVSAGQLDVVCEPTALEPVVAEALATIRPQADAAGLTLAVRAVEDLEVVADAGRLRQVLLNLLSNAVKFTPSGGRITVRGARRDGAVQIEVEDTGIGIAKEDLDRIFQEFTQLDSGRDRAIQGTGLGLALSRALVRRMGGELTVRSRRGKGSTFVVRLIDASAAARELPDEVGQPA